MLKVSEYEGTYAELRDEPNPQQRHQVKPNNLSSHFAYGVCTLISGILVQAVSYETNKSLY